VISLRSSQDRFGNEVPQAWLEHAIKGAKRRMPDSSVVGDFPCELLLNGVFVRSFALHSGFDIEVQARDAAWRHVSLEELKRILRSRFMLPDDDLAKASGSAECRLFAPVNDIEVPEWQCGRLSVLGREKACVRYVQRILYRTGIPHLVSGTTFLVPNAATSRIPLKRAGFRQSQISPSALVEPRTGCAIQVVERDPRNAR